MPLAPTKHVSDVFTRPAPPTMPALVASTFVPPPAPPRRDRLWELSANLHCSIVGTCLSTADLRALLAKLGDKRAGTACDHDLHGQAVGRAGRKDDGGKLLHKLLDRRHAGEIARFDRAHDRTALRRLLDDAVAQGRIPGAYWAVLTHPAADHALVQDVFGEVHMLSHLVGRSVRADLRRLAELEGTVAAQADTLSEQAGRIQALTDERGALSSALADMRSKPVGAHGAASRAGDATALRQEDDVYSRLQEQHGRARAHAAAESERRNEAERIVRSLAEDVRQGTEREAILRAERDGLETALAAALDDDGHDAPAALDGVTLLYVGGRPGPVAHARRLVRQRGGTLLTHDGGVADNPLLLPGLVARARAVLFPVDCVSHDAVHVLKRACRDHGLPFLPLRSASLAALVTALGAVGRDAEASISPF